MPDSLDETGVGVTEQDRWKSGGWLADRGEISALVNAQVLQLMAVAPAAPFSNPIAPEEQAADSVEPTTEITAIGGENAVSNVAGPAAHAPLRYQFQGAFASLPISTGRNLKETSLTETAETGFVADAKSNPTVAGTNTSEGSQLDQGALPGGSSESGPKPPGGAESVLEGLGIRSGLSSVLSRRGRQESAESQTFGSDIRTKVVSNATVEANGVAQTDSNAANSSVFVSEELQGSNEPGGLELPDRRVATAALRVPGAASRPEGQVTNKLASSTGAAELALSSATGFGKRGVELNSSSQPLHLHLENTVRLAGEANLAYPVKVRTATSGELGEAPDENVLDAAGQNQNDEQSSIPNAKAEFKITSFSAANPATASTYRLPNPTRAGQPATEADSPNHEARLRTPTPGIGELRTIDSASAGSGQSQDASSTSSRVSIGASATSSRQNREAAKSGVQSAPQTGGEASIEKPAESLEVQIQTGPARQECKIEKARDIGRGLEVARSIGVEAERPNTELREKPKAGLVVSQENPSSPALTSENAGLEFDPELDRTRSIAGPAARNPERIDASYRVEMPARSGPQEFQSAPLDKAGVTQKVPDSESFAAEPANAALGPVKNGEGLGQQAEPVINRNGISEQHVNGRFVGKTRPGASDRVVRSSSESVEKTPNSSTSGLSSNAGGSTISPGSGAVSGLAIAATPVVIQTNQRPVKPGQSADRHGILDAQQSDPMVLTEDNKPGAESGGKNLPNSGRNDSPFQRNERGSAAEVLVKARVDSPSDRMGDFSSMNGILNGSEAANSAGDALNAIHAEGQLAERLTERVLSAVERFHEAGSNDWTVRIRPDRETELNLRLRMHDNQLVIQARLDRGSLELIASSWPDLQAHLASKGVHLQAIESNAGQNSIALNFNPTSSDGNSQRNSGDARAWGEEARGRSPMFQPETPEPRKPRLTTKPNLAGRGWEGWA